MLKSRIEIIFNGFLTDSLSEIDMSTCRSWTENIRIQYWVLKCLKSKNSRRYPCTDGLELSTESLQKQNENQSHSKMNDNEFLEHQHVKSDWSLNCFDSNYCGRPWNWTLYRCNGDELWPWYMNFAWWMIPLKRLHSILDAERLMDGDLTQNCRKIGNDIKISWKNW